MTGKHEFRYYNNGGLWDDHRSWIECKHCGIIDDRVTPNSKRRKR